MNWKRTRIDVVRRFESFVLFVSPEDRGIKRSHFSTISSKAIRRESGVCIGCGIGSSVQKRP
jgi:hypothetical protein